MQGSENGRVVTIVQVPWLPEVTEGHVTPKEVPLGACIRNRKLRNIRPSGDFSPEVTSSPVGLPLEIGDSLGRPRPISSMANGTSPFTGYLPLLFSYNIIYFNNGFAYGVF